MEILFAIALFVIGIVTVEYLLIDAQRALMKNVEYTQAHFLAYEGVEVVESIRNNSFEELTPGVSNLILVDGVWTLGIDTTFIDSKFTRDVSITDADAHTKKIVSSVRWIDASLTEQEVSLTRHLTDWQGRLNEAASLSVFVGEATLSIDEEALINITLENTGDTPITVTEMRLQWSNSQTLLSITQDGTTIFANATSSPAIDSGALVDVNDFVVEGGSIAETLGPIIFNGSMNGSDFLVSFTLSDGSTKDVRVDF